MAARSGLCQALDVTIRYEPLRASRRPGWFLDAAYWQRAGALLVDALVFLVVVPLPTVLALWFFGEGGLTPSCTVVGGIETGGETCRTSPGDVALSRTVFWTMAVAYGLVYSAQIGRGRTLGRRATECEVVDATTEEPIGFGRGLGRTLAMLVSAAPLGLGFLWPLWDPRRRTFHDMIARTRVVSP